MGGFWAWVGGILGWVWVVLAGGEFGWRVGECFVVGILKEDWTRDEALLQLPLYIYLPYHVSINNLYLYFATF